MPDKILDPAVQKIIKQLATYIKKNTLSEQAETLIEFSTQFYKGVAKEDLQARPIAELFSIVHTLWNFIYQRKLHEIRLRIFNPNTQKEGWESPHTIVELDLDDMPFIVDSLRMELTRLNYNIHFIIHKGGMKFKRNAAHQITDVLPITAPLAKGIYDEAPIYIEIDQQTDPYALEQLRLSLLRVLEEVRVVVKDWALMRERLNEATAELDRAKTSLDLAEVKESQDFLNWLADDHFTFLGVRDYVISGEGAKRALVLTEGTGLGLMRDETHAKKIRPLASLPAAALKTALSPHALIISKTNTKSSVHRPAYIDYIGVKRFDKNGKTIGERRILGLYTSAAYHSNPKHIPFLRHKVAKVIENSGVPPKSHAGKTLLNILETLPRDDLFQAGVDELTALCLGILQLQERQRIRLFVRRDIYRRFVSCFVYVPKEWVDANLRQAMQTILQEAYKGTEVTSSVLFTESVLARVHYLIRTDPHDAPDVDAGTLEAKLVEVGRSWKDQLKTSLIERFGEEKGNQLIRKYIKAFPTSYESDYSPEQAVFDIIEMEKITAENPLGMNFYRPSHADTQLTSFKLFHHKDTLPLSDVLPMLENMGSRMINERPYQIQPLNSTPIWINDFGMSSTKAGEMDITAIRDIYQDAFAAIWREEAENDGFNRLVVNAQLSWREVMILRAIAKYLRQAGFMFSQDYIEETLDKNAKLAKILIKIFILRFDPAQQSKKTESLLKKCEDSLTTELDTVTNLDEDRIIRRYLAVIQAIIRTNYFQRDEQGRIKPYFSFKIDSQKIPELPLPVPLYEIFVYSPRFEGIHLRSAKVARGGIRWSDRREDFRTEILGLMKAQKVKNSVIVPSGAKGGFVPKMNLAQATREEVLTEGIACYRQFISGLLDLTDNLVEGAIVPPSLVIRYDGDDPYLVVAADKGTATFSDIANDIAAHYHFWLNDAFASGGKTGYDHKKMGITARGAWESVKRHFRELNIDTQTTDFTVVGIGDMSGDVFGNGMLLSKHIKLVGAFNHQHVFLDPNPDPTLSFAERERLFNLPRSTWADYNPALISNGGGVFNRSAKSIPLSAEIKQLLGVSVDAATPNEVISWLLKAKVDLLFNGGIGTYIKAREESNLEVGDRTNDAVRVNGNDLQCRVVAEGGNLGVTQLGRVAYELNGGIINTDFIDNSAGVDTSDREVNIKILLQPLIAQEQMSESARNKLLADMTDDVARGVLADNYNQTQALSLEQTHCVKDMELYARYISHLESKGKIDRAVEFLPEPKQIKERKVQGKGLTRPELAVLLAYTKMIVKEEILQSKVCEDPYFSALVTTAFPARLAKRFSNQMQNHSLHRELVATQLSNFLVNDMGITFVYRLRDETGAPASAVVRAYACARTIFDLPEIWHAIERLDYKVQSFVQLAMMYEMSRLIRRGTRWILRNRRGRYDVKELIDHFRPKVKALEEKLSTFLVGEEAEKLNIATMNLHTQGVPLELAQRVSHCRYLFSTLDIIEVSKDFRPTDVAAVYFSLGDKLQINWFREQVNNYVVESHWDALAREALRDEVDVLQRSLSVAILRTRTKASDLDGKIVDWIKKHQGLVDRWQKTLTELKTTAGLNFAMLSVALRELLDLTQTGS